jgi:ankyrin repeat protein
VDVQDVSRVTPLMLAAWEGHVQAVRLLLELGADPERRADQGVTARAAAREKGHEEVLRLLEAAVRR